MYKEIADAINFLLKKQVNFAIYRHPLSSDVHLIVEQSKQSDQHFLVHPFHTGSHTPIRIHADHHFTNEEIGKSSWIATKASSGTKGKRPLPVDIDKASFIDYVEKVQSDIQQNAFEKLVVARTKTLSISDNTSPGEIYIRMLSKLDAAFVYLFYKHQTGCWIGATPELLITQHEKKYSTVSLAGTKLISDQREWTEKEKTEQQFVTHYIHNQLADISDSIFVSESKTIRAGHLEHIQTNFSFTSDKTPVEIANTLHPTPAICGSPKSTSFEYINAYEQLDRAFYSGFLGPNDGNKATFYVNLRCAEIIKNQMVLYVGAGITKDSVPESEWLETEEKARTIEQFVY